MGKYDSFQSITEVITYVACSIRSEKISQILKGGIRINCSMPVKKYRRQKKFRFDQWGGQT